MAGPNDLVTLAQAYAWLSITPGSDDTNLQLAISAYSQLITDYCGRTLVQATFNEFYDGRDMPRLTLRNYPVTAVSSLSIFGIPQSLATTPYGPGYAFNGRTLDLLGGDVFPRGQQNVAITYQAGYATIPVDLQMACLEWMQAGYLSRPRDSSIVSRKAGDTEEKYQSSGAVTNIGGGQTVPMPAIVYAILDRGSYRNVVPA